MKEGTQELKEIIAKLDGLLYKGYLLKTHTIDAWNTEKEKSKEKVSEYKKAFEEAINLWLRETAEILVSSFSEKVYYFHFIHPKDNGLRSTHSLGNLISALERHLFALEDVIVRLEEKRSLSVRREIADKEHKADILYEIGFSWHIREIKLNNMVLSRPNSDSKAVNFFEYVYAHQNEQTEVADIEKQSSLELADSIQDILRDLGFKGNIRKVFFPIATKKKVMFVNPITKQYAIKNDLPTIKLSK